MPQKLVSFDLSLLVFSVCNGENGAQVFFGTVYIMFVVPGKKRTRDRDSCFAFSTPSNWKGMPKRIFSFRFSLSRTDLL